MTTTNKDAATERPWELCAHLESAEKDAACGCGYRGGIWGGGGNTLVCEMRNCGRHEGHEMVPVGTRAEQLANAALIVNAVNSYDALRARVSELEKALEAVLDCAQSINEDQTAAYALARAALGKASQ